MADEKKLKGGEIMKGISEGAEQETQVDSLFVNKTIPTIRTVEQRARLDIENKREELRQLVGERYRDMIESADSVISMKEQSINVSASLNEVFENCQKLQKSHFIRGTGGRQAPPTTSLMRSAGSMNQLLLHLREKIWSSVKDGQYLLGCSCYLLCQHVINQLRSVGVVWPNIFYQIWQGINELKEIIIKGCHSLLQQQYLTEKIVLDSCIALILMEKCTIEELITSFLLNKQATLKIVCDGSISRSVRDTLKDLLFIINNTLLIINELFIKRGDSGKSRLLHFNDEITADSSFLSKLIPVHLLSFLPDSIKSHKLVGVSDVSDIDLNTIRDTINDWIHKVHVIVQADVTSLLSHVTSLKGLANIRQHLYTFISKDGHDTEEGPSLLVVHSRWSQLTNSLIGHDISLYRYYIEQPLLEQAKVIINGLFVDIHNDNKLLLSSLIDQYIESDQSCSSLLQESTPINSNTSLLNSFCQSFNDLLSPLIDDLKSFAQAPPTSHPTIESFPFDWYKDINFINEYVINYAPTFINRFLEEIDKIINSLLVQMKEDTVLTDRHINKILLLGRLCHSLVESCPNLLIMTRPIQHTTSKMKSSTKVKTKFQDSNKIESILHQKSIKIYNYWVDHIVHSIDKQLNGFLNTGSIILTNILNWEKITITEESIKGELLTSVIYLPAQVSLYLSTTLYALCQEITRVGLHQIDRSLIGGINKEVFNIIINIFEKCLDDDDVGIMSQETSLQMIFDVQYVAFTITPSGWKEEWQDVYIKYDNIISKLKDNIDPFDYDVYLPHFNKVLERQCQRTAVLLGMLRMYNGQMLSSVKYITTSGTSGVGGAAYDEKHVVLPLSSSLPRLSLLPASTSWSGTTSVLFQSFAKGSDISSYASVINFLQHY